MVYYYKHFFKLVDKFQLETLYIFYGESINYCITL